MRAPQAQKRAGEKRSNAMHEYTTEELERRALLTEQIARNLETIAELNDRLNLDLIGSNLIEIEHTMDRLDDLDEIGTKSYGIVSGLEEIESLSNKLDLDEIGKKSAAIAANLARLEESEHA
jgi:hypothetical protein